MLVVPVKGAVYAQSYIAELRKDGLDIDTDFTWSYMPSEYDGWDDTTNTQPYLEVRFVNPAMESFYRLKWL